MKYIVTILLLIVGVVLLGCLQYGIELFLIGIISFCLGLLGLSLWYDPDSIKKKGN